MADPVMRTSRGKLATSPITLAPVRVVLKTYFLGGDEVGGAGIEERGASACWVW